MGEVITLSCPSCGGKLEASQNASVLACQHCGSEHLIRREGDVITLESFARCPRCGRNDRAEKVTTILRKQINDINPTITQTFNCINKLGKSELFLVMEPKYPEYLDGLARYLKVKYRDYPLPKYKSVKREENIIGIGIILVILSSFFSFSFIIGREYISLSILGFIGIIAGIFILSSGKRNKKSILDENVKLEQAYDGARLLWHFDYNRIKKAHDHLYYCHRDDCVFIPNKGTYAPVEDTMSYLYNNLEN